MIDMLESENDGTSKIKAIAFSPTTSRLSRDSELPFDSIPGKGFHGR
jgi:hypothetical protein